MISPPNNLFTIYQSSETKFPCMLKIKGKDFEKVDEHKF